MSEQSLFIPQEFDGSLIGDGFALPQVPDPIFFDDRDKVQHHAELQKEMQADRRLLLQFSAASVLTAGAIVIDHTYTHDMLDINHPLLWAPNAIFAALSLDALRRGFASGRNLLRLRRQQ